MIPYMIEAHLRLRHQGFEHLVHPAAMTAQELAAAEHVSGRHVAKPVIVRMGGQLAIAVVAATDQVDLASLEEATGLGAELATEDEFARRFAPCEAGAEPPLAVFGFPIYVDTKLESERTLVMPAGTHEDAVVLDTHEWMRCERVQPISHLGTRPEERRI
jgi:Ala-tRNA(Pro) deacylase